MGGCCFGTAEEIGIGRAVAAGRRRGGAVQQGIIIEAERVRGARRGPRKALSKLNGSNGEAEAKALQAKRLADQFRKAADEAKRAAEERDAAAALEQRKPGKLAQ